MVTIATKQCTLSSAADCSLKAFTTAMVLGSSSSATRDDGESDRAVLYEVKDPALILFLSTCNVETMARALGVTAISSAAAAASFFVNLRLPARACPALQVDVSRVDATGKAESKKAKAKGLLTGPDSTIASLGSDIFVTTPEINATVNATASLTVAATSSLAILSLIRSLHGEQQLHARDATDNLQGCQC